MPLSDAPLNVPKIPGASHARRQKPPVRPKAHQKAFMNCSLVYCSLVMRSRVRKPSTGKDTCNTTSAMETVRNLL